MDVTLLLVINKTSLNEYVYSRNTSNIHQYSLEIAVIVTLDIFDRLLSACGCGLLRGLCICHVHTAEASVTVRDSSFLFLQDNKRTDILD